jgi:hypothetical protein
MDCIVLTFLKVLQGLSLSIPFLVVRLIYACLSVYSTNPVWSALSGSVAALVCMHSMMEYVVVLICLGVGYTISPVTAGEKGGDGDKLASGV